MATYTAERIALEIIESGNSLPPLPSVGQRLLVLARQPIEKIDIPALSKLIEGDPALTTKLLQLANSSYYGTLTSITNVRQAIMHIGLEETLTAVSAFFYRDALPHFPEIQGLTGRQYWDHSWACATANRMLGHPAHTKLVDVLPGELYIVGLLMGIGKLLLAMNRADDFQRCLFYAREHAIPLEEAEQRIIHTSDTEIAYFILKRWNFPERICSAIRHSRSPERAVKEFRPIAAISQMAYFIGNTSGIGSNGDTFAYELSDTYISENWILPKAERQQQELIIKDIYTTLQKKSQVLSAAPQTDRQTSTTESSDRPDDPESGGKSKKQQGFFKRLLALVK